MKYRITFLLNVVLSIASIVGAQNTEIDGEWSTFQYTEEGKIEVIYKLKTRGNELSGKVGANETEYEIENGSVKGNTISFVIKYGEVSVYHRVFTSGSIINQYPIRRQHSAIHIKPI